MNRIELAAALTFVQPDTTHFILGSTCLQFSVASYISENNLSLEIGIKVSGAFHFFLRFGCLALVLQRHCTSAVRVKSQEQYDIH